MHKKKLCEVRIKTFSGELNFISIKMVPCKVICRSLSTTLYENYLTERYSRTSEKRCCVNKSEVIAWNDFSSLHFVLLDHICFLWDDNRGKRRMHTSESAARK